MDNDSSTSKRREFLKITSAVGITGVTGCLGGGGSSNKSDSGSNSSGDGKNPSGGGNNSSSSSSNQNWPDLSGQKVRFITDETATNIKNFLDSVAKDFQNATGATVKMDYQGTGGSADERVIQLLQAGDPPELVLTGADRVSQYINQGAAGTLTHSVNSVIDQFGKPTSSSIVKIDGEQYMMPLQMNVGTYWYRGDIIDEEPTTWEKTLQAAKQADGTNGLNGTYVSAGRGVCTDDQLLSWLYTNNAKIAERKNGEIVTIVGKGKNRDRWIETLEFLKKLHQYSPKNTGTDCSEIAKSIPTKTAASSWYVGARPKLQSIDQNRSYAADVHPVLMPKKRSHTTYGGTEGYATFKDANTEAANTYAEFIMQPKYVTEYLLLTPIQNIPAFPGIQDSPEYKQGIDKLPDAWSQKDIDTAFKAAENTQTMATETNPPNPYAGNIAGQRVLSEILTQVLTKDRDPASVVDEYAKKISDIVEEAKNK